MSFSYKTSGEADTIRADVKAQPESSVPMALKEFILLGIHSLKEKHGPQVMVDVSCEGTATDVMINVDKTEIEIVDKAVSAKTSPKVDAKVKAVDVPLAKSA